MIAIRGFARFGRYFKGAFLGGQRTGLGVFRASDGTLFRGFFVDGQRHGHLIKWPPQGNRFLEEYRADALIESSLIAVNSRCKFRDVNGEWMVKANACINGLAHGIGKAASLTGLALIEGGEWVLGGVHDRCARLRLNLHRLGQHMTEHVLAPPAGYGHLN